MTYALGSKSLANLSGVHPDLVKVVHRAIQLTKQDFSVHDGLRTIQEQRRLVKSGASKTMASKHFPQPDGYGHAVDLVPFINGQLRWEWPPLFVIAAAVQEAARENDVKLTWGGVWDRKFEALPQTAAGLKAAVNSYVDRRREAGRSAFIDGPHFELRAAG